MAVFTKSEWAAIAACILLLMSLPIVSHFRGEADLLEPASIIILADKNTESLKVKDRMNLLEQEIIDFKMARADSWMFWMAVFMTLAAVIIAAFAVMLPLMGNKQQDRFRKEMDKRLRDSEEALLKIKEHEVESEKLSKRIKDKESNLEGTQTSKLPSLELLQFMSRLDTQSYSNQSLPMSDVGNEILSNTPKLEIEENNESVDLDPSDAEEQWRLGLVYSLGEGVARDFKEAVKWYRLSADQDDSTGQWRLGFMYEYGKGVDEDQEEAVKWYRLSADQDDSTGQWRLGFMYEYGKGVDEDQEEAVKWYRLSAKQGNPTGQWRLGYTCHFGEGVAEDLKKVANWYRKSALNGNSVGQYFFGSLLIEGNGLPQDFVEARAWLSLAKANGDEDAEAIIAELDEQMTKEDISDSQKRVKELQREIDENNE